MTITPEQARARLESKPNASRIERRAYRTIAGMTYEYAVQIKDTDGEWKAYEGWGWKADGNYGPILLAPSEAETWTKSLETAQEWAGDSPADETRIVRRLVTTAEVIE